MTTGKWLFVGFIGLAFAYKIMSDKPTWTNEVYSKVTLECLQKYPSQSQVAACVTIRRKDYE